MTLVLRGGAGTDRKITNWDAYDGTAIRIVDGSASAEVAPPLLACKSYRPC